MNIAYTKQYRLWRSQCEGVFQPDCRFEPVYKRELPILGGGWRLKADFFEGSLPDYLIHGSEYELINADGNVFYRWRNLNNDGEFCQIICHRNNRSYLIFRCDLYGYSVLDLNSGEDFHYMPNESFPCDETVFSETFIWTKVFYEPVTSLLAVEGCFWACPSSVMLLDFSSPMTANEELADLRLLIDPNYEQYDDIGIEGWKADGCLSLKAYNCETDETETITFHSAELKQLLTRHI